MPEALKLIDSNAHEAEKESEGVRHRLTTVAAEIGKLVNVRKNSESQVSDSIRNEMTRLESERRELETRLRELQEKKTPHAAGAICRGHPEDAFRRRRKEGNRQEEDIP